MVEECEPNFVSGEEGLATAFFVGRSEFGGVPGSGDAHAPVGERRDLDVGRAEGLGFHGSGGWSLTDFVNSRITSMFFENVLCKIGFMEIEKISLPARRYVAVRHTGAYNTISTAIMRLFELAIPLGIQMQGAPSGFWYDDPESVPEAELSSAAAFPVADDFTIEHDELHTFDIPAGEYLTFVFYGPYAGLGTAWGEFTRAVSDQNPDWSVCFEEYLNDCEEVAPEDIQTRLLVKSS